VIFEQIEGIDSCYLFVILDGASGPPALRAGLTQGVTPSTFDSDESSTT
jgi:hypothetical protein